VYEILSCRNYLVFLVKLLKLVILQSILKYLECVKSLKVGVQTKT